MVVTTKQCLEFNKVYNDLRSTKMPFQTSYHLFLLKAAMDEHLAFYAKQMQSLAAEYSEGAPEVSTQEIKISKEDFVEIFNSVASTEYGCFPDAMYFMTSANAFRLNADGSTSDALTGYNRYLP